MAKKRSAAARYDIDYVRQAVRGRAAELLSRLGGLSPDILDGRHHPCPKCGGTDRFRLVDADAGAVLCNQCFRSGNGDLFAALAWITGRKFADVLASVADYLGIQPTAAAGHKANGHGRDLADPAEHLAFQDWDESTELLAATWCLTKRPIAVDAIRASGGRVARYRQQYTVIALPVWGEAACRKLAGEQSAGTTAKEPVGWCLYNITGGPLPKFVKQPAGQPAKVEWVKVKLTYGSQPGVIGDLTRLKEAKEIWKVEGPSDLMAALSVAGLPPSVAIIANANGAQENPPAWMLPLFAGRAARVLHDADKPGQDGSLGWTDSKLGRPHVGWAQAIATTAAECRNATLPYPLSPDHGKDLRDWLNEQPRTWSDLQALAESAEIVLAEQPGGAGALKPLEGPDNYHRLARVNLERYGRNTPNGTLRYWRNEWYKYDGTCYRKIDTDELKAKVGQAVREEFERINAVEVAEWNGSGEPPNVRNVGHALISNVLFATSQICILSGTVELNTWIDGPFKGSTHRFVALRNGILDIDALLAGEDSHLHPHSPHWFSVTCLPFNFDPEAPCEIWQRFLSRNLENDEQRINLAMEWAGYLLLPNTDYQKFMFFEGEGANGKSVFLAAIEAMIGELNCSHVSLEAFSKDFVLTQTLGKLVNIASECSEMDSVAEGLLKAVASGDRMTFNRKGIPPIEATPTARLMLSANVRPRFADKSSGLWRRMILMPWRIVIQDSEKVIGMDKVGWWERSGELPGIFNWAIAGLDQLTKNKGFTRSDVCEAAIADYRSEVNPVKTFIAEHFVAGNQDDIVATKTAYELYKEWSLTNGYRPASDRTFGREISRQFSTVKRERIRSKSDGSRFYAYVGLSHGNVDDSKAKAIEETSPRPKELFV